VIWVKDPRGLAEIINAGRIPPLFPPLASWGCSNFNYINHPWFGSHHVPLSEQELLVFYLVWRGPAIYVEHLNIFQRKVTLGHQLLCQEEGLEPVTEENTELTRTEYIGKTYSTTRMPRFRCIPESWRCGRLIFRLRNLTNKWLTRFPDKGTCNSPVCSSIHLLLDALTFALPGLRRGSQVLVCPRWYSIELLVRHEAHGNPSCLRP